MFKHILVPLDGSSYAERALGPAIAVARTCHARLTLVQAISEHPYVYSGLGVEFSEDTSVQDLAAGRAYLEKVVSRVQECGIREVETAVQLGNPATVITRMAAHGSDLVVMSTHGRSGLPRLLLGSVAAEVVHEVDLPVLLVGNQQPVSEYSECEYSFSHLLVPLDGTDLAEQALPVAEQMAAHGASLLLLKVVAPQPDGDQMLAHELGDAQAAGYHHTLTDTRDIDAHHYLSNAAHQLPSTIAYTTAAAGGDPAQAILATAHSQNCDLIVLATHARQGMARLVKGSVAERVVSHAQVPVLLLRGHVRQQLPEHVSAAFSSTLVPGS